MIFSQALSQELNELQEPWPDENKEGKRFIREPY
jgi:hypothetical protein